MSQNPLMPPIAREDIPATLLRFGIAGYIADGMLVRISNIDRDAPKSWALHQDFFAGMTAAMAPPVLARVIGAVGG